MSCYSGHFTHVVCVAALLHTPRSRGSHSRESSAKPTTHAEQAWIHQQKVENYLIGRPCTTACRYNRTCGLNVPPSILINAHEHSYGRGTRKEVCPDGTTKFHVALSKKQTMLNWRKLAMTAISWTVDDPPKRVEHFTVCGRGPVCADFWRAAYGIPLGTANGMLAAARSGSLRVDVDDDEDVQMVAAHTRIWFWGRGAGRGGLGRDINKRVHEHCGGRNSLCSHSLLLYTSLQVRKAFQQLPQERDDDACAVTLIWWQRWLEAEDQMPNEPVIQHRAVVWQSVYEHEYVMDVEWWGISRALSRSRWLSLREKALDNLSIEYFGAAADDATKPAVKMSLVQRAKHSNFGSCSECTRAKERWLTYRRCD